MRIHPKQDFACCWTTIMILMVVFHEMAAGQPQVYFKASLPAKSLPRIGRRSDADMLPLSSDGWNDMLSLNSNNYIPRPQSVLLWKKIMGDSLYPDESQIPFGPNEYKFKQEK